MTTRDRERDRVAMTSFWSAGLDELAAELGTSPSRGLGGDEAERRLVGVAGGRPRRRTATSRPRLLLRQFASPIPLILIVAATIALFVGDRADSMIGIVVVSGGLGYFQERGAARTVETLLSRVQTTATVIRRGQERDVPSDEVVPGDLVVLRAGDGVPGDLPEMAIASDRVDEEQVRVPRRWDIRSIRRFMLLFGPLSSVFDYLTFAVLLVLLGAPKDVFRTGWFVESVVSATVVVLVLRTARPVGTSRPGRALLVVSLTVAAFVSILPALPGSTVLGMERLPGRFYVALAGLVCAYALAAEAAKRWFYRGVRRRQTERPPVFPRGAEAGV